jgi:uncharacterized membrane protein YqiK
VAGLENRFERQSGSSEGFSTWAAEAARNAQIELAKAEADARREEAKAAATAKIEEAKAEAFAKQEDAKTARIRSAIGFGFIALFGSIGAVGAIVGIVSAVQS